MDRLTCKLRATVASAICATAFIVMPAFSQTTVNEEPADTVEGIPPTDELELFKQARYAGTALLIHLPTNRARALIMPERVTLQGDSRQMPGVQIAYEGEVIGFFATRSFSRRSVSFIGVETGFEYRLRIRASELGLTEPLEIIR